MIKKMLKNKTLFLAVSSCVLSFLLIIITTFAWFALTDEAKTDPFVLPVGMQGSEYEFGEVINSSIIDQSENKYEDLTAQPGNHYTFVLTVKNVGDETSRVSAYFTGVRSIIVDGADNESTDYTGREEEKIQYIYHYKVTKMYWNTTGRELFQRTGDEIIYPTDEEIADLGWVEIDITNFDNVAKADTYFNQQIEGEDVTDYYLFSGIELSIKDTPQATIVVFFELTATNIAMVPGGNEMEANVDIYGDQIFDISNIIITSSRE